MADAIDEARALQRFYRLARTERLRDLREASGLSQADTARFLGVNPSQVSRWEAGRQRPRPRHALRLLELLEP